MKKPPAARSGALLLFGLCVILLDVSSQFVVSVAFGTSLDGFLHQALDAVDVVHHRFLGCLCGGTTHLQCIDDVLNLLATVPDGVVEGFPFLRHLPVTKRLAAHRHDGQDCQCYDLPALHVAR